MRVIKLFTLLILGLVVFSLEINAATITVTNTNDSGQGSLRNAVEIAEPLDTIDFALSGCPCVITLTTGEIVIDKALTINGPGANNLSISGSNTSRVFDIFYVAGGVPIEIVTIRDLSVIDGNGGSLQGGGIYVLTQGVEVDLIGVTVAGNRTTAGGGAGIYIGGSMTVTNSSIANNISTDSWGGGILAGPGSELTVINSTITGNSTVKSPGFGSQSGGGLFNNGGSILLDGVTLSTNTSNFGGGIYNYLGTLNIYRSTISGNTADDDFVAGGGIYNSGAATLNFTNSTLSGNTARANVNNNASYGGGIYNGGTLNITNATLVGNSATNTVNVTFADGGGIYSQSGSGTIVVETTIIAENTAYTAPDVFGEFNSQGYNLIGIEDGSYGLGDLTSQRGSATSPLDPLLGPLQNNGGPTSTHALLPGSPAIDKSAAANDPNGNSITTDQRNFSRPVDDPNIPNASGGDGSDIGAFEVQPPPASGLTVSPASLDFGQVAVNKTKDLVLTVTNNTAAPIELAGVFPITQVIPQPFEASGWLDVNGCRQISARTLDPGESCTQTVRFWSVPGAGAASPASLDFLDGTTFATLVTVPLTASVGPPDTAPNSPPIAVDDLAGVAPGFTHTLDATRNDSDPDNDLLRIMAVSDPPNGTASVVSCGSVFPLNPNSDCIQYTPDSGYEGIDSIVYTISDGRGGTATATYHLAVGNVVPNITAITPNSGPVAGGQSVQVTGSNFLYRSEAAFVCSGSILPLTITQLTDTEILATTPAGAPGACDLRVRTLFNHIGTLANAYTYTDQTPADTTPPIITPTVAGTLGNNGWYGSNVQVSWSVVDNESAVTSQTGCGTQIVSSDTGGVTFTCSATSTGGTSSQSVTIKRDATPPTITFNSRTPPNANGWNNTNVTAQWNCADALSGPQNSLVSFIFSLEGANQPNIGTCFDQAGNSASAAQGVINIDKTPPTLAPVVTPNPVVQNGVATASPNAADTLSGVASQSCASVITSSVGNFAVGCTAADNAGNTAAASANFQVVAPPATGVFPIVFSRLDGNGFKIFKINSDGNGLTRLTNGPIDFEPAISPDGTRIVFQRGFGEIYVMNAGGSSPVRLTNDLFFDTAPDWSRLSTNILFSSYRYRGFFNGGSFELVERPAFITSTEGLWTTDNFQDLYPAYSPVGAKMAFSSDRFGGNYEIVVYDPVSTTFSRLTTNGATDTNPTWSPDGTKIAFATNRDGNYEIYSMNANGTGLTRLTYNPAADTEPWWGPDGRIVFTSTRYQNTQQIHIMNANGGGVTRLTSGSASITPHW